MASVNLSGTLTNPEGEPDEGAIVKFTLLTTTGNTVSSSKSQLDVPQDGLYDIDIVYGNLRVDYINEDGSTRFVAIVTVNGDTVATSLPELLNAVVPPTDAQLLQFQAILADAITAKTGAELAETGALAAEAGAVAAEAGAEAAVAGAVADIVNIRRETVHNISILTDAVANTDIAVGDAINLAERTAGNGGGAMWDVVLASGVTANTFNIVACTGIPTLALVLRTGDVVDIKQFGAVGDGVADDTLAISEWIKHPQKNKLLVGSYLVTNITETVSDINISGGGSLSSTGGASAVVTLTGDSNIIDGISVTSQLNQQQQTNILSFVGNGNQALSNTLGWDVFLDPVLEGEQYGSSGVAFTGNENVASKNYIFNVNTGVSDDGIGNVVSFNTINKAARGVLLTNKSRHSKVLSNYIDCGYAGLGLGGCDGVWGGRNHRYSVIDGNTILFAGEHGTYLQGDSYTVTNNIVRKCQHSGIKAGAKSTGNFWYAGETVEELAPNGDYTGFDIVIANNVCTFNEVSGGTTGEIYLQPNLMNVIVKDNVIRNGGAWGIRSVFFSGSPNDVMKGITISGNEIHSCAAGSISCASSDIALIKNNITDGLIQTDSRDSAEPLTNCIIEGNKCGAITIYRADNALVLNNTAESVGVVSNTTSLKNNKFTAQENGDFSAKVLVMFGNEFTYNGLITASQISLQGCDDIQSNYFKFPDATASFPLDVIFNSATPTNGAFNNNEVSAVNSPRPVRVGGSNSTINDNRIYGNGVADYSFGIYADNCVISGNVINGGIIRLEAGSSGNIVNGNAAQITDSGTSNLLSNNRP